ncbi:MAG: bifunctional diaminohydroxyphosphoribosylaminopyrimidine deaminase/5-amino-6-(5-phosphoribosylamino)uracil reductase RibD [Anaerostipes sp.]|nr:bifunctional diaminohydroxyphosphoribosylaminopyrimidine deaminase/5-amino-6-(5-phosphoribosylamino)uracil reductase RibD [Anaerostipes sp.]
MKRAIELAEKGIGYTNPNPAVGAVIVKDGRVIGEGYHETYGGPHAERNALKNCTEDPKGAELYVTLEPCCHYGKTPPCTEALIESGIRRVYVGNLDPNPKVSGRGVQILREHGIQTETGIMEEECRKLNDIFFHYISHDTPYVALKYAMTLDGKTAVKTGESKWITGEEAREHVHYLRHRYAAILVGIKTVLCDDPMLNARVKGGNNPIRIICDSRLKIPLSSKIVQSAKVIPVIVAACERTEKAEKLERLGCRVLICPEQNGHVDLLELFRILRKEKIDSVLVEGGADINESVIRTGAARKVYAYIAPKLFGGRQARSPVEGEGIDKISQAVLLNGPKVTRLGGDLLLEYEVR